MTATVLALEKISKRFGTTQALLDTSLTLRRGRIHALLGENGAGKTTLMRIAYGLAQPDGGTIHAGDGEPLRFPNPAAAIRAGVGMVHQHFTIVRAMTIAENVALGGHGRFDRRATGDRVHAIARTLGVTIDPDALAGSLSVPAQQQLEIIKALSRDVRLLILDEPTAVLAPVEVEQLMARLRILTAEGLSVVLITHKLREALAVADDVTVLRLGSTVLSAQASGLTERTLGAAMVGSGWSSPGTVAPAVHRGSVEHQPADGEPADGEPAMAEAVGNRPANTRDGEALSRAEPVVRMRGGTVLDIRGNVRVRSVDLDVRGGEIVGIAGVAGSGTRELLRALAGRTDIASGSVELPSLIGFIPEDRHLEALALDFSLTENIALREVGARGGFTPWRSFRMRTAQILHDFDVRSSGPESVTRTLSGGNQQKLVLARELDGAPSLLVAENPTRGLDPRASAAVHARLRDARAAGMAIVVYSSDLDELLTLADRTCAMFDGTLIVTARTRAALGQAMLGAVGTD